VRRGGRYRVAFRRPGLRCRLAGRPERALKVVLQEAGVPPWLRDRVPLLYVDGELAAVADLGVCEGFVAEPGSDAVSLSWAASVAG
jgi:tRNA(Ile)-lysidine synthase